MVDYYCTGHDAKNVVSSILASSAHCTRCPLTHWVFWGKWDIYHRVRFLSHVQNEVIHGLAKGNIKKRTVFLILFIRK